jgi:hypothetical protein
LEALNTAHSDEVSHLAIPQQFLRYAYAYLEAASILNARLANDEKELTYVRGCVPLFLARHAVELFLKAAVLSKSPDDELHHDVEKLGVRYGQLYPEELLHWDVPFGAEPIIASPEVVAALRKERQEPGDQRFRYPTNFEGMPWKSVSCYIPSAFKSTLQKIRADFDRLSPWIW